MERVFAIARDGLTLTKYLWFPATFHGTLAHICGTNSHLHLHRVRFLLLQKTFAK